MTDAIPERCARTPRTESAPLTVPRHVALLPRGGGSGEDRFQGGSSLATPLWLPAPAALLRGRRGIPGAIQSGRSDEGHATHTSEHAQFQTTGGRLAQHADRSPWEPAVEQAHQLPGTLSHRLMSPSQLLTHPRSRGQHGETRQGTGLRAPGKLHHHGYHDPSPSRTAHGVFATGQRAVARVPSRVDVRSPPPFQRLVTGDLDDGFDRQQRRDDQQEQAATNTRG